MTGQRKNDAGGFDAIASHQDSTVMEWCVSGEQVEQQLTTELSSDGHTWVEKVLRPQITAQINNNQGSAPLLR